MRSAARVATLLLAALASAPRAAAQDAHYWTYGYGPIGQLTEGTLVGGVSDLSAVYYNPGALALLEKPRFLVGLTSVELANIEVPGAAGEGLNVDQLLFDVVPSMLAGHIGSHEGSDHFAFAFLSRHDSDWDLGVNDVRVSAARPDARAGFGRLRQRLVEYWLGGSWSHRFSDRLSAGVSPFLAYRAQRSRRSVSIEEISDGSSRAVFVGSEYEYNHVRALAKAGLAWRPGAWQLGITLTTPGLGLWSQGKTVFNASATGDTTAPFLAASTRKGLAATYRAPWAVGAGASWRRGDTTVHTTAERFSSVAAYDILEPAAAPVAGRPDSVPLVYRGEAEAVACYGLGLEQRLSSRLVVYFGAAHNESAYVAERDSFAAWDLTDLSGGFTVESGRATLAFGVSYAWGASQIPQAIVLPDQPEPAVLREARFSRWTISVGAAFH